MVNTSSFNRRNIAESMRFLFLFDSKLTSIGCSEKVTLRQQTQISLGMELIFGILKVIVAKINYNNSSSRSELTQTALAFFGIIQFISTLVLFVITFVKNDFKKIYFSYVVYTILFIICFYMSILLALLEVIFDSYERYYLIIYVLYYILSYYCAFIIYVFTKQLGNENFTATDKVNIPNLANNQLDYEGNEEYRPVEMEKV